MHPGVTLLESIHWCLYMYDHDYIRICSYNHVYSVRTYTVCIKRVQLDVRHTLTVVK